MTQCYAGGKLKFILISFMALLFSYGHSQVAEPATVTAIIGAPANGPAHHITVSWSAVSGATSYILQYSNDSTTWNTISTTNVTTFDHNASNTGNIPVYYRVATVISGNQSGWAESTTFPIYTACDNPALPQLSNAGAYSMTIQLVAESPTPNAATTTYAIYCITTSQYVQANGNLGAGAVYQTRTAWGTINLTGLTASTNYCFYTIARNGNGDTRIANGSTISAAQTFDASGSLSTSNTGPTNVWWTPAQPTSYPSRLAWLSTGGCSGGTGAGNAGFTGSSNTFTNYFGSFLRSPATNCTGNSSVVVSFNLTNSYIASHIVSSPSSSDAMRFYMYIDGAYTNGAATSIKINGTEVSSVDGNGRWLKFTQAWACQQVDVTFDLSTHTNLSNVLFYLEADDPYNDQYAYNVNIDNVSISAGSASACLSTTACTAATVSTNPSNQSVCANGNAAFSVVASGSVASYQWQLSTDGGATWNNVNNGGVYSNATTATLNITGVTSGLNNYSYRCLITGACSGTPTSNAATLTVSALPGSAGSVNGTATVCQNTGAYAYSIASVSGATGYTWSLPTGASITGGSNTNNITVSYSSTATSGNIIVTPTNTCGNGTASAAFAVTVNQLPSALGAISGATTSCSGIGQTYSVASVNGATSYTWTLPNGWTGSSSTNSITATPSSNSGNVLVTANNSCGSTTAQTLAVSVSSAPAIPGTITGSPIVCRGINTTYSVAAVNGATSYTWTIPSGWTGTSTTNSITVNPALVGGNITVTANNSCGSSQAQTLAVSTGAIPSAPAAIIGSSTACGGDQLIYSVAPVNGAYTYTWTLPGGWSGNSTTDSIHVTAASNSGTISVTAGNACGNSSAVSLTISAGAVPATPGTISGASTVCTTSSNTYSVSAVNGATSYTWTLPNGWSGTSTSNSINATAGANSGNISVTANNACGSSAASQIAVTSGAGLGTPGSISGSTSVCGGSSSSYSIPVVSGATSYTWTLPNGWTGTSTTNSIQTSIGNAGGTISVVANGSCGISSSSQLLVTVSALPATPGAISGTDTVCSNIQTSYGIALVSGATTYTWTLPNGWTGSSITNSITATSGTGGGYIFVTANNGCGSSAAQSVAVGVVQFPTIPGGIVGPDSLCIGSSGVYSVATIAGPTTYNWILPNGWQAGVNGAILTATAGSTGGNILITASNACGTSAAQSKAVSVNQLPQVTFNYTGGPVCTNTEPVTLNSGSPTGGTYNGIGVSGSTFNAQTPGLYVLTYTVTDGHGCSNSDTAAYTVENCTGVNNIVNAESMQAFPNPFSKQLAVQWSDNQPMQTVVIYDLAGREVYRSGVVESAHAVNLNLNNIASGSYLLNLITTDGKSYGWHKIVKQD